MRLAFAYVFDDETWLGGRNYFSSLFTAIQTVAPSDVELVLVTGRKTITSLPQQFPFLQVIRTAAMDRLSPAWTLRQLRRLPSLLTFDPMFAGLLRRHRIDVFSHSCGLGRRSPVKSLGWLPDFQFMHLPGYWTAPQLRDIRRSYEATCRHSNALIVSSRAALQDLEAFYPYCATPRYVLHFVPMPVRIGQLTSKDDLLKQYQLPSDYFHLPNQFWAHKNHNLVIDALVLLKERGVEATVVCTGSTIDIRRPEYFETLMASCRHSKIVSNFRVLGVVPYATMQALMTHSRAVINPSRFEGWSTSVEEAKALGKTVLLSDIAVHREQAPGDSAYFSTDSAEELATLMIRTLDTSPAIIQPQELERQNAAALSNFGNSYLRLISTL